MKDIISSSSFGVFCTQHKLNPSDEKGTIQFIECKKITDINWECPKCKQQFNFGKDKPSKQLGS